MNLSTRDPVLIGLCGRAGSGKTAAAEHLRRAYDFEPVAFADALKDMLALLLADRGVDHAVLHEPALKGQPLAAMRGHSPRLLMQTLGDWGRDMHPDFWAHQLAHRLGMAHYSAAQWHPVHDRIAVADVRYPNEARWVQERGGVVVRLHRSGPRRAGAHSSEASVDMVDANLEIHNEGPTLAGLHAALDAAMAELGVAPRESARQ